MNPGTIVKYNTYWTTYYGVVIKTEDNQITAQRLGSWYVQEPQETKAKWLASLEVDSNLQVNMPECVEPCTPQEVHSVIKESGSALRALILKSQREEGGEEDEAKCWDILKTIGA